MKTEFKCGIGDRFKTLYGWGTLVKIHNRNEKSLGASGRFEIKLDDNYFYNTNPDLNPKFFLHEMIKFERKVDNLDLMLYI